VPHALGSCIRDTPQSVQSVRGAGSVKGGVLIIVST